jgi:uncharacterized protein YjbI with pentapeptide repeats
VLEQIPEEKRKELINHLVFYENFEKKLIDYPSVSGYYISALGIAIIYQKKEIVEMLLEHGADINVLTTYTYKDIPKFRKDFSGDNALIIAYKMGDPEIINLLQNADMKNLSNAFLSKINLSGVNLSDSNLSGANLLFSDLTGAEFINTKLVGANLVGATLINATLINAKLMDAKLLGAKLMDADLTGAKLMNANLTNANLMNADLTAADLTGAILTGANFTGATLTDAILPDDFFIHDPNDFIEPEGLRSPRTRYSNRMETTSIAMLGGKRGDLLKIRIGEEPSFADASSADASSADASSAGPHQPTLFQMFSNYSNLSKLHIKKIDCVFQTLFSLGLRDIHTAKHESNVINKLGFYKKKIIGVQALQLESYVQQIFGLEKENTKVIHIESFSIIRMNEYLSTKLLENTCTILLFTYKNGKFGHCVTAFKHNNQIYIFDPQLTTTYSSSIYSFKEDMSIIYEDIDSFTVICLNQVLESKPLILDNCSLPILIAGRRKKSRKNKKTKKNKKRSKKYLK